MALFMTTIFCYEEENIYQGIKDLFLHNSSKSTPVHCHVSPLVWGVCLYILFGIHQMWRHAKVSRGLVACSDATFQIKNGFSLATLQTSCTVIGYIKLCLIHLYFPNLAFCKLKVQHIVATSSLEPKQINHLNLLRPGA